MPHSISEVTRRDIVERVAASGYQWAGRLDMAAFLARACNFGAPSSGGRWVPNPHVDVAQLVLNSSDEDFLRFIAETIQPAVRSEPLEVFQLLWTYNDCLSRDGWELFEAGQISGRPVYAARRVGERIELFVDPTGWEKVDRQAQESRDLLAVAQTEEQFQAVGLVCRETLISVAQEVFNPDIHVCDVAPSTTDAGRMLGAVFGHELQGSANEEARNHAKAALRLALALQHKRTADFRMAALCAEATVAVVNLCAILAGRRDPLR